MAVQARSSNEADQPWNAGVWEIKLSGMRHQVTRSWFIPEFGVCQDNKLIVKNPMLD
jgi:hypothetical protein